MWQRGIQLNCVLAWTALAGLAQGYDVTITPLNTPADMDLSRQVVYALNFGNSGHPTFDGLVFSQDQDYPGLVSLSCTDEMPVLPSWYGVYPNTADATLDLLIGSAAWTNNGPGACATSVSLDGLVPDTCYQLQLMFYEAHLGENPPRRYDIMVGGETIVELYDVLFHQGGVVGQGGSVLKYVFTAKDRDLHIQITPVPNDGNYLSSISGLILTTLLPSPDFNRDYTIDIDDLVMLIEHWGQDSPLFDLAPEPAGDGIVDRQDLEALMGHWGEELPDPRLLAHWRLDEMEGATASDSADSHDADLVGTPTWQPAGGKVKGALQLDGIDDHVASKFVLKPEADSFSVFAWVKGGGPGQVILSQRDVSQTKPGASWLGCDPTTGCLMTAVTNMQSRALPGPLVSSAAVSDGAWHHVGLVYDAGCRSLYVDGIEVARDLTSIGPLTGTQAGLNLGAGKNLEPSSFWSGLIDDVRIYDQVVIPSD